MADEIIRVEDRYYILAASPRADDRSRVLKHGETFAVFDQFGDISPVEFGEEGLYHEGTRHLNHLRLRLDGRLPLLLSSTVRDDNSLLAVDLSNPDIERDGRVVLPHGAVHALRSTFLWSGVCYIRVRLHNYATTAIHVAVSIAFDADFADIFEVRGTRRNQRGTRRHPEVENAAVTLVYDGLDGVERRTRLEFEPAPEELTGDRAMLRVTIDPDQEAVCSLVVRCGPGSAAVSFDAAYDAVEREISQARDDDARVRTSNERFNDWLDRSVADLHMMVTRTPEGPYPYAGVPWFSTVFGRDGIVTALETAWLNPSLARGVLAHLAATQSTEFDPARDAQPGRILHESRKGEMAALREVPFGRYYGSIDATPLYVMLAADYWTRTGDRDTLERLWPHVEQALAWIDGWGDPDGDGLFEYARQSSDGLVSQGWKDSADAVFHADGRLAEPPVALCEVQAYVYAARRAASGLAAVLGDGARALQLQSEASELQRRFEGAFWCEDLATYALALDARKQPCRVRTSNAGHCLFAGIAGTERAVRTGRTLLDPTSFSGWGVRTVATTEARYNPMSYHNGSVWPHDNALVAAGLARYGMREAAQRVLGGLFDASACFDLQRLPELFCGFPRRPRVGPTHYPLACAPQAWAAGAVFLLLRACLGMCIDAPNRTLRFERAGLPPFLDTVWIENLRIGDAQVDLELTRHDPGVGIRVLRREGEIQILVVK